MQLTQMSLETKVLITKGLWYSINLDEESRKPTAAVIK